MQTALSLLFFSSALLFLANCQDQDCTVPSGKSTCVCDTGSGLIDLTSMGLMDGNPFFSEYDDNGNQYFYNPCHGFTRGTDDSDPCYSESVGVCQAYSGGEASCGTEASEKIVSRVNDDNGEIEYYILYDDGTEGRASEVHLICDETADTPYFQPYGDVNVQLHYEFDLTTKCACPGGCEASTPPTDPDDTDPTDTGPTDTGPTDGPGGGGGGSSIAVGAIGIVIMTLLPVALLTYFIVGAIILKFKFQKTGTEIIPQKAFWFALPLLIRDGCLFTFSPIISLVKRNKTVSYDNI